MNQIVYISKLYFCLALKIVPLHVNPLKIRQVKEMVIYMTED